MYDTEFAGDRDPEDAEAKVTIFSEDNQKKREAWNRRMASAIRRYRRDRPGSLSLPGDFSITYEENPGHWDDEEDDVTDDES